MGASPASGLRDDWDNYSHERAKKPRGLSAADADRLMRAASIAYMDPKGLGNIGESRAPAWLDKNACLAHERKGESKGAGPAWMNLKEVLLSGMGGAWPPMTGLTDDDGFFTDLETCTQAAFAKSTDGSRLLLSIRGSTSGRDWLNDALMRMVPYEPTIDFKEDVGGSGWWPSKTDPQIEEKRKQLGPQGRVHRGFYRAFLPLLAQIDKVLVEPCLQENSLVKEVSIVGHSLGGGISTLCLAYFLQKCRGSAALDETNATPTIVGRGIKVTGFTVGGPRVGDEDFRAFVCSQAAGLLATNMFRQYRVENGRDIIPSLGPHRFSYRHQGRVCQIALDADGEFQQLMFKHEDVDESVSSASEVVNLQGHWTPPTFSVVDAVMDHIQASYLKSLGAAHQEYMPGAWSYDDGAEVANFSWQLGPDAACSF